jgi:hypothetical protein
MKNQILNERIQELAVFKQLADKYYVGDQVTGINSFSR